MNSAAASQAALPQRIVVIAGYAPSLLNFRGPLLQALKAQGHQVIALAPAHDAMGGDTQEVADQLAAQGIHFVPYNMVRNGVDPRQDIATLRQLTAILRALRPTTVLTYTVKPNIYGSLAAARAHVPHIFALVTGLGYAFTEVSGTGLRGLRQRGLSRTIRQLYRQAFRVCRRVIFQNPDDRDLLVGLGLLPHSKTCVVNGSGLDLAHFKPRPLPDGAVFLMIARLLRAKGVKEYAEAAAQVHQKHPQAQFLLLGPVDRGPDGFSDTDIARWQAQGIEYLGVARDVRPYIEQASVYVLPSYREGTPRTVLEAMAMGRPVVTTDAPGCRETVADGVNGFLVPVRDTAALADRMSQLAEHARLRAEMGQRGIQRARENYDVHLVNAAMLHAMNLSVAGAQAVTPSSNVMRQTGEARPSPHATAGDKTKRALDAMLSAAGLAVLSLPMLGLAALVRARLGSPVLFTQVRPGLGGELFTMYKFRTMTDERSPDGKLLPDAERLTPFGRFLRSTSLDELPELYNVLRGEMSLVGPRPLHTHYLPLYNARQRRRHEVRPGITGWAQVNGRNALSWEERFELDVWYVDHRNLLLDLKILLMTLKKVLVREGISSAGEATMYPFTGTPGQA